MSSHDDLQELAMNRVQQLFRPKTEHDEGVHVNDALFHAMDMMKSESARCHATLQDDFSAVLRGNCVYLRNLICNAKDMTFYETIKQDLLRFDGKNGAAPIDWSKHQVYENPTSISPLFCALCKYLDEYFDVEIYATRLNYYADGTHWKPYHHDSHAYGGKALREDFTVGLSLGATRGLNFLHEPSGMMFAFPQSNGDCFAFTNEVNTRFKHGVPKACNPNCGDRFSIIAWGRRRSLNARNGGGAQVLERRSLSNFAQGGNEDGKPKTLGDMTTVEDAIAAAHEMVSVGPQRSGSEEFPRQQSSASEGGTAPNKAKKKKNRLQ